MSKSHTVRVHDVPPSWGFYKGADPLVRVDEAGSRAEPARKGGILEQDVNRPSGEPARLGGCETCGQMCRSGESAIAVEALVNNAG